jgi:hypothetical protein
MSPITRVLTPTESSARMSAYDRYVTALMRKRTTKPVNP